MSSKPSYTQVARKFLAVKNLEDLSRIMKVPPNLLLHIAKTPSYRSFKIPKSNKGYRLIDAPQYPHLLLQKRLNRLLQHVYNSNRPAHVHGFVVRFNKDFELINVRSNALTHTGENYVINLDLKNFFHSISASQVRNTFMKEPFQYDKEIASLLAILTTWYNKLPMGAPTSPVISNLICLSLDRKLSELSERYNLNYSRYADDLTFSGDLKPEDSFFEELYTDIEAEGFEMNKKKFRIQSKTMRQVVTGITVNEKPNLPRKYYRNLRAILYNWEHNGIESTVARYYKHLDPPYTLLKHKFLSSLKGKIDYLGYVRGENDPLVYKLKEHYYRNKLNSIG